MSNSHCAALRAVLAIVTCLCTALPAVAQQQSGGSLTFKVQAAAERLEMVVNTSRIMEMPFKVPRVFVANPDIVSAKPLSPTQIQLSAVKPGVTQVNVWDEEDKITTVDIVVYGDARELELLLRSEFPDSQLKIRPLASSVYISGFVPKQEQVGQIVRMAEDYYPKVINNLTVGGVQQILLNVRVMEVSRTKLRQMGIDWSALNQNFFVTQRVSGVISNIDTNTGLPITLPVNAVGDSVRFGVIGSTSFFGFLDLLRENDLAKLMAEPKLTTISGRAATFNVGGQVPIPIAQSLGTVTVQYKDFGTQIDFIPIALGNGNIRLEVRPDVTEVDPSLRDATTGVPGFRRRYADTAVEMRAGQTMAIAGLIYQRTDTFNRGIPWLADLPWVGAAFRKTRELVNEVELVITVTPEFVDGMDCEEAPQFGPGQNTMSPNDVELYWRGYIEKPNCTGTTPFCPSGCQCQNCQAVGGTMESLPPAAGSPAIAAPPPAPTKGASTRSFSAKENVAAAAPLPQQPLSPPQVQTRATTSVLSNRVPVRRTDATPAQEASTSRLPQPNGSVSRLRQPVQAKLSDESNLFGPQGYDRMR
jgi:pilus assembly protein CpaC